jgi:uncharacterized membrane protein YhaH (DUF805 family)
MSDAAGVGIGNGVGLVVACVFGILVLFLLVQFMGNPISQLGGMLTSALYSVVVYVPVIVVCVLALRRAQKGRY